jgi:branched-chain amino acid transport system ATP-binding protein
MLLQVEGLSVAYGKAEAVRAVALDVAEGEIVTILGANGAGKTSALSGVMGLLAHRGLITFDGEDVSGLRPEQRLALGLSLVTEQRDLFARLSVMENLELGAFRRGREAAAGSLERIFNFYPRLRERKKQIAGTLSGGERQMLAIGRALMSCPKLLMLDEPSLGLAPLIVQETMKTLQRLAGEGISILLVEQNARAALGIAQRGYVMEGGSMVLEGSAGDLLANKRLEAIYLGGPSVSYL